MKKSDIFLISAQKHRLWVLVRTASADIFLISAQNIDCGYSLEPPRRGGSNEYPQSIFLSRNKKNNGYPCKPQFYSIKVGFKGVIILEACFCDTKKSKTTSPLFPNKVITMHDRIH